MRNCPLVKLHIAYSNPRCVSDLPVVPSCVESLFSDDTGPDVVSLLTVSVKLQLLSSLHLLPVLRQDQKRIRRHWVQHHVLWK